MNSYVIEPADLSGISTQDNLLVIDMGSGEQYLQGHIPGAVNLDFERLRLGKSPAPGLMPDLNELEITLGSCGVSPHSYVVAYDHDYGAKACRLLWTLEACGHTNQSLLNGGITAWIAESFALQTEPVVCTAGKFKLMFQPNVVADRDYVLDSLGNPDIDILDARSTDEFDGIKSPSLRNGHIPGAKNLNWLDTIDETNSKKLKSRDQLMAMVHRKGFTKDREIIVHCQTHQRSSHSFVMLRNLGFEQLRGYAGSWSEWGNDVDLPIV